MEKINSDLWLRHVICIRYTVQRKNKTECRLFISCWWDFSCNVCHRKAQEWKTALVADFIFVAELLRLINTFSFYITFMLNTQYLTYYLLTSLSHLYAYIYTTCVYLMSLHLLAYISLIQLHTSLKTVKTSTFSTTIYTKVVKHHLKSFVWN